MKEEEYFIVLAYNRNVLEMIYIKIAFVHQIIIVCALKEPTISKKPCNKFVMPKMTDFANPHLQTLHFIRRCARFIKVDWLKCVFRTLELHVPSSYDCELT